MKRSVALVACALALALAAPAAAQPRRGGPGPGPGAPPDAPDLLKLTLQQKRQIHDLRTATLKKVAAPEIDLRVKHSELEGLWLADQPKRDAILRKLAEIDALQAKVREAWIDFELGMLKLLTPAQRTILAQQRGPGHLGPGMGPGMGRGMGPGMGRGMGRGMGPGPHGPGMGRGMGPGCPWGMGPGPGPMGPPR